MRRLSLVSRNNYTPLTLHTPVTLLYDTHTEPVTGCVFLLLQVRWVPYCVALRRGCTCVSTTLSWAPDSATSPSRLSTSPQWRRTEVCTVYSYTLPVAHEILCVHVCLYVLYRYPAEYIQHSLPHLSSHISSGTEADQVSCLCSIGLLMGATYALRARQRK